MVYYRQYSSNINSIAHLNNLKLLRYYPTKMNITNICFPFPPIKAKRFYYLISVENANGANICW